WLIAAKRPLVIASSLGRLPEEANALADIVCKAALPVVAHSPRYLCLLTNHPLHHGFDPHPFLEDADFILVIESDVPWMPVTRGPSAGPRVAHTERTPRFCAPPCARFRAICRLHPIQSPR